MVEMSRRFKLPPVIRRFGRCGGWEQQNLPPHSSEIRESSQSPEEIYQNEYRYPSCYGGEQTGTDRVKSFVSGIVSPFTACWQPSEGLCVPGCTPDNEIFQKQPAVVTPHLDRSTRHRDRGVEREHDEYSHYISRHHKIYHPSGRVSKPLNAADADGATTTARDKRTRNTDIAKPRSDDILCGRGGSSNRHLGNIHFRELVAANKQIYVGLTKKQKMSVARKIVDVIHNAGGRFLAKDLETGLFYDIGLPRSLEKTSQALREKHSNEMPVQPVEDEGIETSVESHHSVIKKNLNNNGSKCAADESSAELTSPSKSTSKSLKNTEAPSLIIPSHLMDKFGQKGSPEYEGDRENNRHPHSPREHHSLESSHGSHHPPFPSSPYNISSAPSPPHHAYQSVAGHPTAQPGHPHHQSLYPASPYQSHPHYYYHGHPPHSSPYSGHHHQFHEQYAYPAQDHEVYNGDYYPRSIDYEKGTNRRLPHETQPHQHFRRFQPFHPLSRQQHHHIPHSSRSSSQRAPLVARSIYGPHTSSPHLPTPPPSHHSHPKDYRHDMEKSSSSLLESHDGSSLTTTLRRKSKNGHVRYNSDISTNRQQRLKRQRNGDGHTTRNPDAMLSTAVENSLSLDERVVGREREKQQQHQENDSAGDNSSNDLPDLIPPSTLLQRKSSGRNNFSVRSSKGSPTEKREDYSTLSGLAALSTAAFLKMDEEKN